MVTHLTVRRAVSRRPGASLRYCALGFISSARSRRLKERMNIERERLLANVVGPDGWKHWGPYLSERQWGTVREDYSPGGTAWEYFPHDHARSRAYRWGEDGIGGLCDGEQLVCLSLALWNGADPLLKERMFGLTNAEGNHGEDVKEHYFYLDATPTHAYLKMLYKYPHRAFSYADLGAENARRGTDVPEYELLDTGIFAENRYFDVFIEYAQGEPGDILMKITVYNRGPSAMLHVIPQLVLRNTWSWEPGSEKPEVKAAEHGAIAIEPGGLGVSRLYFDGNAEVLYTENETNAPRLWNFGQEGYFKDAFHDRIVQGLTDRESRAPGHQGRRVVSVDDRRRRQARISPTPVAAHSRETVPGFRYNVGTTAARGGCLLCGPAKGHALRRRARGAAAGIRRTHLEQAVLLLRPTTVAQRRSRPAKTAGLAPARPQRGLAKPEQCRHSVDA